MLALQSTAISFAGLLPSYCTLDYDAMMQRKLRRVFNKAHNFRQLKGNARTQKGRPAPLSQARGRPSKTCSEQRNPL